MLCDAVFMTYCFEWVNRRLFTSAAKLRVFLKSAVPKLAEPSNNHAISFPALFAHPERKCYNLARKPSIHYSDTLRSVATICLKFTSVPHNTEND